MTFAFKKAERTSVKLKIGVQGPSGSGKTFGALALARTFAPDGKVAVIDTENESASFYADDYEFETLSLGAPYTSARYVEAIKAAVDAGFDVLIIDSISHQWAGTGGILERKDETDKRGGNSYTNWGPFTKEHELFKARILEAPIHIISTLRTKQDYALEANDKGKQAPKKLGMAPIQREGFEYEFGIVFELQMDHNAKVSKDRTGIFDDSKMFDLRDKKIGEKLQSWLASGKPEGENGANPTTETEKSATTTSAPTNEERTVEWARDFLVPHGSLVGQKMGVCGKKQLGVFLEWAEGKISEAGDDAAPSLLDFRAACQLLLESKAASTSVKVPAPGKVQDALEPELLGIGPWESDGWQTLPSNVLAEDPKNPLPF